jgi:hypothetical protein
MGIIQNDSLKLLITEMYEQHFPFLIGELKGEWELYQSLILPFIYHNIQYINADIARPNNYNNLKTNDEFRNLMGYKMTTRKYTIQFAERAQEKVDSLIFMIDRELGMN